jgi:hypothetical protein
MKHVVFHLVTGGSLFAAILEDGIDGTKVGEAEEIQIAHIPAWVERHKEDELVAYSVQWAERAIAESPALKAAFSESRIRDFSSYERGLTPLVMTIAPEFEYDWAMDFANRQGNSEAAKDFVRKMATVYGFYIKASRNLVAVLRSAKEVATVLRDSAS